MSKVIGMSGKRFGKLFVVGQVASDEYGAAMWVCRCGCGNVSVVRGYSLRNGDIQSCGCSRMTVQGQYGSKVHRAWKSMLARCNNSKHKLYPLYGGRGIAVCKRWLAFDKFYSDMGDCPDGMRLVRVNLKKGFTASNCQWAE